MRIGAHESVAGGLANAFVRADEDGAESVQIFTHSSRQWAVRPLGDDDVRAFRAARRGRPVLAHASYLLNPAADPGDVRRRTLAALVDELERCEALEIPWLVLHPGSHADEARGIVQAVDALNAALRATRGCRAGVLLEGTAGQGRALGHRFEHLRRFVDALRPPERVGVCLDTCHLFAAGWDLTRPGAGSALLDEFDRRVGLSRLHAFHLNDSLNGPGSRVDRHARIGEGRMGTDVFAWLVNEHRLADVPGVLETPPGRWKEELALLRSLRLPERTAGAPARPPVRVRGARNLADSLAKSAGLPHPPLRHRPPPLAPAAGGR